MLSFCILILGVFYKLYSRGHLRILYTLKTKDGLHVSLDIFATLERSVFALVNSFSAKFLVEIF
jgi:hypothetical protein